MLRFDETDKYELKEILNDTLPKEIETYLNTEGGGHIFIGVKKNGEVRIQGFGTFKSSKRKARTGVNPQNPSQKIKIPAMNVVTFKAGSEFKAAVK